MRLYIPGIGGDALPMSCHEDEIKAGSSRSRGRWGKHVRRVRRQPIGDSHSETANDVSQR